MLIKNISKTLQRSYECILLYFVFQKKMIIQDKLEKERNDAKNGVEEYVYDLRDKLCGIYEKYVTEDVRT